MGRGTGGEQKWLAVVEEIWDNKEHFLGVLHGVTLKLCCCDASMSSHQGENVLYHDGL